MASCLQGSLCCFSASALGASFATLTTPRRRKRKAQALGLLKLLIRDIDRQECSSSDQHDYSALTSLPAGSSGSKEAVKQQANNSDDSNEANSISVEGWQGFSMEDARKRNEELKLDFKELTPKEVLTRLQKGNARFWTGNAARPEKSAFERRALIMQQFPLTAVLGCSDSRVPVEVVFDQALGDMFVVRVAGNCLSTATSASLQYAVHHLKVKVLMVMGHEGCGAIKAAQLPPQQINQEPEALSTALKLMKAGLDEGRLTHIYDRRSHDREAVVTNIRRQVQGLCRDAAIMQKVANEELIIVGCFYEISSGIVDFFMEITEALDDNPKIVLQEVKTKVVKETAPTAETLQEEPAALADENLQKDAAEVQRLELELEAVLNELSASKQREVKHKEEVRYFQQQLESMQKELSVLQEANEKEEATDDITRLQAELLETKTAEAQHEQEILILKQQLESMEKELTESRVAIDKEESATEQVKALQVEIEQSKAHLDNLHTVESELAATRESEANHRQEAQNLQQQLESMRKELADSHAAKEVSSAEEVSVLKDEITHLKNQSEADLKTLRQVEAELVATRGDGAKHKDHIQCLQQQLGSVQKEMSALQDEIANLRKQSQADIESLRTVEAELSTSRQVEVTQADNISCLQEELLDMKKLQGQLLHKEASATDEVKVLRAENESLKQQMEEKSALQEEIAQLRKQSQVDLESAEANEADRISCLQEELLNMQTLQADLEKLREVEVKATNDITHLQAEVRAAKKIEVDSANVISRLQTELQAAKQFEAEFESELAASREAEARSAAEIQRLNEELRKVRPTVIRQVSAPIRGSPFLQTREVTPLKVNGAVNKIESPRKSMVSPRVAAAVQVFSSPQTRSNADLQSTSKKSRRYNQSVDFPSKFRHNG